MPPTIPFLRPVLCILPFSLALSLMVGGCGKKTEGPADNLQTGFAQSDEVMRAELGKADAAFKARDYPEAVLILQQLFQRHELTETERQAARVVCGEITQAVAEDPSLDSPEFFRARSELLKRVYGEF